MAFPQWSYFPRNAAPPEWVDPTVAAVGIQVDGPLDEQHLARSTGCAPSPLTTPGDVTFATGLGAGLPFRISDVRLVGAKNISLAGAYVAVIDPGADGVYPLPPLAPGWPSIGGTVSPSSLVPAAGATLTGPALHALVLRLRIDDPTVDSSFQDVGLDYRSGPVRHEKRLQLSQRLVVGGSCT